MYVQASTFDNLYVIRGDTRSQSFTKSGAPVLGDRRIIHVWLYTTSATMKTPFL